MAATPALEVRFPADPGQAPPDGVAPGDLLLAGLTDLPVLAVDEGAPGSELWRVYFASTADRDAALAALAAAPPVEGLSLAAVAVEDEDWAARSQANLTAIRVGRITVTPPWDPAAAAAPAGDGITIVIRPSMGFGTGHHATTRLCLDALQRLDLTGAAVTDVGTGSGVLAIAARRLGAATVLAFDDDGDAVDAARDSLALNPGVDVTVQVADLRHTEVRPADVVTANLTGGLLIAAASMIAALGHRLVLSGFQPHERTEVLAAFPGWTPEREAEEDGWCVAVLRQPAA